MFLIYRTFLLCLIWFGGRWTKQMINLQWRCVRVRTGFWSLVRFCHFKSVELGGNPHKKRCCQSIFDSCHSVISHNRCAWTVTINETVRNATRGASKYYLVCKLIFFRFDSIEKVFILFLKAKRPELYRLYAWVHLAPTSSWESRPFLPSLSKTGLDQVLAPAWNTVRACGFWRKLLSQP